MNFKHSTIARRLKGAFRSHPNSLAAVRKAVGNKFDEYKTNGTLLLLGVSPHLLGEVEKAKPAFQPGQLVVIRSAEYGKSYVNQKVLVENFDGVKLICRSKKRKSPLTVDPNHVELVADAA